MTDGDPAGSVVADIFRLDLREAGVGDGGHGFAFLLPWGAPSKSTTTVQIAEASTGRLLPGAANFSRRALRPVEDRLDELERQSRLLASRIAGQAPATDKVAGTGGRRRLGGASRVVRPPLRLASCAAPEALLLIEALGDVDQLLALLAALHGTGLDRRCEIAVIDDGRVGDVALLPSVVENVGYVRLRDGASTVEMRNRLALGARAPAVVFAKSRTRPTPDWLDCLLATFAAEPSCAVVAPKLVTSSGTTQASGLIVADGQFVAADFGDRQAGPAEAASRRVAAVTDAAMAVRSKAFSELGGFDAAFADPAAAAIDLCIRCWAEQRPVLYLPACAVSWDEGAVGCEPEQSMAASTGALLVAHWQETVSRFEAVT